jgi:hypothetical protein
VAEFSRFPTGIARDLGALHAHLLRCAREAEKRKPVRTGKYDLDRRPALN